MNALIEKIMQLPVETGEESRIRDRFVEFISHHPDCFLRSNLKGHITASAFVVDRAASKLLLIHHKKLDKWLQPGGHCDGDEDTLAVAIKEVFEETGVQISAQDQPIIDLDIHTIPERKGVPEHEHFDVRYLFDSDSGQALIRNHETLALQWIPWEDIRNYTEEESVLRILKKIPVTGAPPA